MTTSKRPRPKNRSAKREKCSFLFDQDLLTEIDEYGRRMRDLMPGMDVSRTNVVRHLIRAGLDHERRSNPEQT